MKKVVFNNYDELCNAAADIYVKQLKERPDSVLGLATGSTPIGLYSELERRFKAGEIDFSKAQSFNLDEYFPIDKIHPQSYDAYMRKNLFEKVNFASTSFPNSEAEDPHAACAEYDAKLESAGGIDLMLLGIGHNGHIGFNEPATTYSVGTYMVDLAEETLTANSRFFTPDEKQPTKALTMGIGTIFSSKRILLLITGTGKAEIASKLFEGKIHTDIPASFLLLHPDVTIFLDKDAAGIKV